MDIRDVTYTEQELVTLILEREIATLKINERLSDQFKIDRECLQRFVGKLREAASTVSPSQG